MWRQSKPEIIRTLICILLVKFWTNDTPAYKKYSRVFSLNLHKIQDVKRNYLTTWIDSRFEKKHVRTNLNLLRHQALWNRFVEPWVICQFNNSILVNTLEANQGNTLKWSFYLVYIGSHVCSSSQSANVHMWKANKERVLWILYTREETILYKIGGNKNHNSCNSDFQFAIWWNASKSGSMHIKLYVERHKSYVFWSKWLFLLTFFPL